MKSTTIDQAPRFQPLKGVEMAIIGDGERITFIHMMIQPGAVFPDHSHPNEQIGTCLEGRGELVSGGKVLRVEPGVSWSIPSNERHSFKALGDGTVVIHEVWSPPREDYIAMARKK